MKSTTYIALLRGINVTGHNKIRMVDLKKLFEELGHSEVQTYIQSGNVVFKNEKNFDTTQLAQQIALEIKAGYNYDVPVLVLTAKDLENVINQNPFAKTQDFSIEKLYLTILSNSPVQDNLQKLPPQSFEPDEFNIHDRYIFIQYHDRYSSSKLNNNLIERKLQVNATTRNWKTMLKLFEMV